eukprot:3579690-Alexandrium_andersonii.AAC.1
MGRRLMGRAGGANHRAGTPLPCALTLFPLVRKGRKWALSTCVPYHRSQESSSPEWGASQ